MIPLIDCSPIEGNFEDVRFEDFNIVAQDLGTAMTNIGMCNLINHGIDKEKIARVHKTSQTFFNLPAQTKMKYKKADVKQSFNGYAGPGDELLNEGNKNSTELREVWDSYGLDGRYETNFPNDEVPEFREAYEDIRSDLENASKKLLRCIEIYLHLNDGALLSKHKHLDDQSIKNQTVLRSLYYFNLNKNGNFPPNAIRCGEHSDWGTTTLLIQDMVEGLQVKTMEGEWIDATPVENTILLNSGQLLEYWTGGRFHAALHRVKIRTDDRTVKAPRQSIAYFVSPDAEADVFPLVEVLNQKVEHFEKFNNKPINAYNYFQQRAENAYY